MRDAEKGETTRRVRIGRKSENKEMGVRLMEIALEAIACVTEDGKISLDFLSFEGNGMARGDRS